jgi:hypothetical protein
MRRASSTYACRHSVSPDEYGDRVGVHELEVSSSKLNARQAETRAIER